MTNESVRARRHKGSAKVPTKIPSRQAELRDIPIYSPYGQNGGENATIGNSVVKLVSTKHNGCVTMDGKPLTTHH